jgi:ATP-dependent helicase STH1/SNF2
MNFLLPSIFETGKSFDEWFNEPLEGQEKRELTMEENLLIIKRLHNVLRCVAISQNIDMINRACS